MKPPIAYFGGKTRLAPWLASMFPPHRVYIEPFCGSAAVLFAKAPAKHEIINDIDGDVVHFFKVLRDRPADLEYAIDLTPYARDEYACSETAEPTDDDVERARRWWVRSTQSFGQSAGSNFGWSISVNERVCRPRQLQARLPRFASIAERLTGVFIENSDAVAVIERYDEPGAVIYCDPPYLWSTRTSFNDAQGARKRPAGDYRHEYETDEDHVALADALRAARGAVILSGYASPLYEELYDGWFRYDRDVALHMSNGRAATRPRRTETIWSNRELAVTQLALAGTSA